MRGTDDAAERVDEGGGHLSRPSPPLESLGEALLFERMRAVGDTALAAGLARGEDLAGVAEATRVESLAELVHEREVGLAEDERHVVHLLEPDPVLARDGTADLGAHLEDLAARLDHARFLAGNARIVEDVRMQVAVARVEDVADTETVRGRHLVHPR